MNETQSTTAAENTEGTETGENVSRFFGTAKDVMDQYTHCAICGANLHFTHVTDFNRNLTQESARCPECGVKTHKSIHRLQ